MNLTANNLLKDCTKNNPQEKNSEAKRSLLKQIWTYNPTIAEILHRNSTDKVTRRELYAYFIQLEIKLETQPDTIHSLEWDIAMESLVVAKNIISARSERLTGFNLIELLRSLAEEPVSETKLNQVDCGFLMEMERLFAGCRARSGIYRGQRLPAFAKLKGREAALARSIDLERLAERISRSIRRYPTGMDRSVVQRRKENLRRMKESMSVSEYEWSDWRWQVRNVIRDAEELQKHIELSQEEYQSIKAGTQSRLPFGITPYYVHLMDYSARSGRDRAIRYQVIPPGNYVERMSSGRREHEQSFDFMLEHDTAPCDLITRRYPMICILKPYNTCAQICVYCQRNWEVEGCLDPKAIASQDQIQNAIQYITEHTGLREILITGGDPLILSDSRLQEILDQLAAIRHVERIRIGTRTPVVLPMRITEKLADLLASYRIPGRRDVCVVTHFEHPYEVTPEAATAVNNLRNRGISVFNQVVFTFANCRRFELVALRRILGLIGVEPYYTFSPKGKEETIWYRIPIARLQQARKEEARLTPGTWRTDETVFNVPGLGKNYLNRQQDHTVVAILPDGCRVYEFHPWEKKLALANTYLYTDISIMNFLKRLEEIGEDPAEYSSIWYYY
ncbi:MAG: KamA family radical SAM protein [bacterium]|nr:KamA family radical SAM protein [bacterium]